MATYDITTQTIDPSILVTGDILNCPYSGSVKSITLPKGQYKLECWGAQGGQVGTSGATLTTGGKGGYSVGTLSLNSSLLLYLYSGGKGAGMYSAGRAQGGWNGGGSTYCTGSSEPANGGGGGSDISISGGNCSLDSQYRYIRTASSYLGRLIVAGGGGGTGEDDEAGGYGGGTNGGTGGGASAGTQTSGGNFGYAQSGANGGGAGGGWYGGYSTAGSYSESTSDEQGGSGGSGYVYTSSTAGSYPSGCLLNSSYYLASAVTYAGNSSFISPTGSSETGHTGNGYCRITVLNIYSPPRIYVKLGGLWKNILESLEEDS